MNWHGIGLTALIVALIELVLHWFPWRLALRRDLPRLIAYVGGVLGMVVPLTVLLLLWIQEYRMAAYPIPGNQMMVLVQALTALWAVILAAGVGVALGYASDWIISKITLAHELGELLEMRDEQQG